MSKPRLFVVSQPEYVRPFEDMFEVTDKLHRADVALFTGGHDVHPSYYGDVVGPFTGYSLERDKRESLIYQLCTDHKVKKLGICRGSQFLTAMAGGKLIQHVENHGRTHEVFTDDGRAFLMSSTHHQMMNPFVLKPNEFVMKAWAENLSPVHFNGFHEDVVDFTDRGIEPEVVWYPKAQALCIQPHPEIMRQDAPGVQYCRQLVKEYLL